MGDIYIHSLLFSGLIIKGLNLKKNSWPRKPFWGKQLAETGKTLTNRGKVHKRKTNFQSCVPRVAVPGEPKAMPRDENGEDEKQPGAPREVSSAFLTRCVHKRNLRSSRSNLVEFACFGRRRSILRARRRGLADCEHAPTRVKCV